MTTVTDDFNRADNASLGSNYTTYVGSFGNRITSNTCRAGDTGNSQGNHWATASNTFGSDQFSKATIAVALNAGGSNVYLSMCVRVSGSGGTRDLYQFTCNASNWYLTRVDNGTGTDIASGTRTQVVGEEVECRAVGSTISGWIDGVEITSVTDTAYTSGQPGFEVYNSGATLAAWDDWSGGDLSAGATNLIIQDATHGVAIDNIALTSQLALTVADMAHGVAIDNIALTSQLALTVADMAHGVAIDNLTLSATSSTSLTVADMLHALAISTPTLTTTTVLAIAELAHALAIDNLVLTSATTLAIAELAHAVAIDNLTLTPLFGTNLLIDDMSHAVAIDNLALTLDTSLIIADMAHALGFDNIVLTSATALAIADMLHGVSIDNLTLSIPGGGYSTLDIIFKILTNRQELSPTTGIFTLYDDDSTTVLYTAAAWADAAGTVPYAGGKLQRIDRMT